jgi:hypothetical protein
LYSGTNAQNLGLRLGLYDYTDNVATEFYILSPGLFVDYDIVGFSRLKLNTCLGLTYRAVKYDGYQHHLYFFPLFVSMTYDLTNPDSRLKPTIGAGISAAGKIDNNKSLDKTHYSFTYGYHFTGGLNYKLKNNLFLTFDMRYNILVNPAMEDVNMSGMVLSAGLKFMLKESNKEDQ